MKPSQALRIACLAAAACLWQIPAHAQTASPQQVQSLIDSGQSQQALSDLSAALAVHPDSGVAWYLTAEAQDALGNESAARDALAKAEQYAPGLPFADQTKLAALQAHLSAHGGSPLPWIIGVIVIFGLMMLLFRRRRPAPVYTPGFGGRMPDQPYNPGYGPGGGGNPLLSGLMAGAGFAVGDRIVDDLMGGNRDQGFNQDPNVPPDRDDGLLGSPDWGSSNDPGPSPDSGFDPGNSW